MLRSPSSHHGAAANEDRAGCERHGDREENQTVSARDDARVQRRGRDNVTRAYGDS